MNGIDSTVRVHVLAYVRDVFMLSASIFEAEFASVYIIGQTTSFLTYFNVNIYTFFIVLMILYKDSKSIKTDVLLNMHFDTDVQYQTFFGIEHN